DRSGRVLLPAPAFLPGHAGKDAVRLVPGVALARRDDRTDRDVEPDGAAEAGRLGAERRHALARRGERLGVDRIDVAVPRTHLERAGRGASEEEQGMRLLQRAHVGVGALHAIELAREIERRLARPGEAHQLEVLGGAPIALGLGAEVTVAVLLLV